MKKRILTTPFLIIIIFILVGIGGVTAALLIGGGGGTEEVNLQKGLVGWWKFDGNAKDSTPNSNNGTVTGATLTTDRKGAVNKAYSFDGVDDYVEGSSYFGDINFLNQTFTTEYWIKSSDTSYQGVLLIKPTTASNFGIQLIYSGSKVGIVFIKQSSESATRQWAYWGTALSTNVWNHIVFTHNGSGSSAGIKIYLNGQEETPLTYTNFGSTTWQTNNNTIRIAGARIIPSPDEMFNGLLDDVRIYNRALSQAEITASYESYDPGIVVSDLQKGLVAQWKFDGNAKDSTPYGNNGTVTGATLTTDRKGAVNKAYSFDGTNTTGDYVNCGTGSSLNLGTADFTIEFWTKGRIHDATAFIGKGTGTYTSITEGWIIAANYWSTTDELFFYHTATANKVTWTGQRTYFTNNTWHHWAFVGNRTAGTIGLYRDGVFVSNKSPGNFTATNITSTQAALIGSEYQASGVYRYEGDMDEVRIYNRALSQTEITASYESYDPGIVVSDLQKGLVAQWKFDGNAKDSTPNSNNGTVTGATLTTDRKGAVNKAYSFDGANDTVDCGTGSNLNLGTADFTIEFWVKGSSALGNNWDTLIGKTDLDYSNLTAGWIISANYWSTNDTLAFSHTAVANLVEWSGQKAYFRDGTWHHWVFVGNRTAGTIGLYRDGVFISNKSPGNFTATNITYSGKCYIGSCSQGTARWLNGSLDEVRIYNRALSQTEITALYESY